MSRFRRACYQTNPTFRLLAFVALWVLRGAALYGALVILRAVFTSAS